MQTFKIKNKLNINKNSLVGSEYNGGEIKIV